MDGMNAEKAREICRPGADWEEFLRASGYLAALDGPEVRGLVEALERIVRDTNCMQPTCYPCLVREFLRRAGK